MFALMTIKEIYRHYLQQLQKIYSLNEATILTDRVFESVAGIQRADIIKTPEHVLEDAITSKLQNYLADLLNHKPMQYVLGEAWFYNMKLKVNEHVLIPRPETEELVKLVIDQYDLIQSKKQQPINIIDIGTGSGCIAIALKKNLPIINITAIDVSAGALAVSKENAVEQQVDIEFIAIDFLKEGEWQQLPLFNIIVSNPPYIPLNEKEKLDKNVTAFEPHTALFVPTHLPTIFYEKIAAFGLQHLAPQGKIFVEIHEDFATETAAVFSKFYNEVEIIHDLFGKQRMIVAASPVVITKNYKG